MAESVSRNNEAPGAEDHRGNEDATKRQVKHDTAPLSAQGAAQPIGVLKAWRMHQIERSLDAYAAWLRENPAPDVKPEGGDNASELHWLATPRPDASGVGHPKFTPKNGFDIAVTDGAFFDCDGGAGTPGALESTINALEADGIGYIYTKSHSAADHELRGHVQLIFDRPCPAEQHARVWQYLHDRYFPLVDRRQHSPVRGRNGARSGRHVYVGKGALLNLQHLLETAPVTHRTPNELAAAVEAPTQRTENDEHVARSLATIWGPKTTGDRAFGALGGWMARIGVSRTRAIRIASDVAVLSQSTHTHIERRIDQAYDGEHGMGFTALFSALSEDSTGVAKAAEGGRLLGGVAEHVRDVLQAAEALLRNSVEAAPAVPAQVMPGAPPTQLEVADGQRATEDAWGAMMNARHTVLTRVGGKCRVLSWGRDEFGWRVPVIQSFEDFQKAYLNVRVLIEGLKTPVQIGKWWLEWAGRAQAETLTFRPDVNSPLVDGCVNLWRGYGVEPKAGDWSKTQALLRDVIASGNEAHYQYILRWCAWVMQHPGERAETVLVLRGAKGTGKNTILDALCKCLGQHAKTVSNPRHVVGNFNAHLAGCALLFSNEAIAASDKTSESVLKTLVTDATIPIERKGIDVEMWPNRLSLCMASNESWCVPASLDERRFAVFDVSDSRKQDLAYFAAIHAELNGGGLAAMLHDLLAFDLGDWHPRQDIPKTAALVEQQLKGLRGADRIVYQMLASGELLGRVGNIVNAVAGHEFVSARLATAEAKRDQSETTAVSLALAKCCGSGAKTMRGTAVGGDLYRGLWMPPLAVARETWAKAVGLNLEWDDPQAAWAWVPMPAGTRGPGR